MARELAAGSPPRHRPTDHFDVGIHTHDLVRRGLALSHGHLLTKPFEPAELLSLVERVLAA